MSKQFFLCYFSSDKYSNIVQNYRLNNMCLFVDVDLGFEVHEIPNKNVEFKNIHMSISVNHHLIDFDSIQNNKLDKVLLHKSSARANISEIAIMIYSITSKETKHPIHPLYHCFFLKDGKTKHVEPYSDKFGEEINFKKLTESFKNDSNGTLKKYIVEKFMEPLKLELKDIESMIMLARKYCLDQDTIDDMDSFKDSNDMISYLKVWHMLKSKLQETFNFRIAFMEGSH